MMVYHGSTLELPHPDASHSQKYLDFGTGFYTTTYQGQAEKWALRKCLRRRDAIKAVVNAYEFDDSFDARVLRFEKEELAWLEFVCACRRGEEPDEQADIIIGPVANDDVFKTVDMYFKGLWDVERTIRELRYYRSNDQIVFKNDAVIHNALRFTEAYEVLR